MKTKARRITSALMAFALAVGLLAAMPLTANAAVVDMPGESLDNPVTNFDELERALSNLTSSDDCIYVDGTVYLSDTLTLRSKIYNFGTLIIDACTYNTGTFYNYGTIIVNDTIENWGRLFNFAEITGSGIVNGNAVIIPVATTMLEEAIATAQSFDYSVYVSSQRAAAKAVVDAALADAEQVLLTVDEKTQDEIDAAAEALVNAMLLLDFDLKARTWVYGYVQNAAILSNYSDYVAEYVKNGATFIPFVPTKSSVAEGQRIADAAMADKYSAVDLEDTTDEQLALIISEMYRVFWDECITALKPVATDLSDYMDALNAAKAFFKGDYEEYTAESVTAAFDIIGGALALYKLDLADATQEQVDAASSALKQAIIDANNALVIKAFVVSINPTASVEKLNGNQNELTIIVTEAYSDGSINTVRITLLINNNAADVYEVGNYKVYVDTKGNTQIRACYLVD